MRGSIFAAVLKLAHKSAINVFSKERSASNGPKLTSHSKFESLIMNMISNFPAAIKLTHKSVINVFLEGRDYPNGLKFTSYSTIEFLTTNMASDFPADIICKRRRRAGGPSHPY